MVLHGFNFDVSFFLLRYQTCAVRGSGSVLWVRLLEQKWLWLVCDSHICIAECFASPGVTRGGLHIVAMGIRQHAMGLV